MDLLPATADDVVDLSAARPDQLVELGLEDDIRPGPGAVQHDDAVLALRHFFEQSPQGCDADAAGNEQCPRAAPTQRW